MTLSVGQLRYELPRLKTSILGAASPGRIDSMKQFRCDRYRYIGSRGGCVYARIEPTWTISRSARFPAIARHILRAQRALSRHWGNRSLGGSPLTRNRSRRDVDLNRAAAQRQCAQRHVRMSCDEYPFASTDEGCAFYTCSVAGVPSKQNFGAGGALNGFYCRNRVIDGDRFWVRVVP